MSNPRPLLMLAASLTATGLLVAAPAAEPGKAAAAAPKVPPALAAPPVVPKVPPPLAAPAAEPKVPPALAAPSATNRPAPTIHANIPIVPPAAAEAESEMDSTTASASPAASPGAPPLPADVVAKATARLQALVDRQHNLLADAEKKNADMDDIQQKLQTLIFDYDDFLRAYPTFAPGYVTYGMLLDRVGMQRASVAIMMKANKLDPDLPIVKNQIGNYLAEEGQPLDAANYYLAAIQLAPKEPLYHYQLGRLLDDARDQFLKSGQWTRSQLDHAMQEAFKRASELAPGNIILAYRYAESFYDVADPDWNEALKVWGEIEQEVSPGLEKDTIRLQAANILIKQKRFAYARLLLETVTVPKLQPEKQKLLDELPAETAK